MRIMSQLPWFPSLPKPWPHCSAVALALLVVLGQAARLPAQITEEDLTDPSLTDAERKQATLLWLDQYLADAVLMSKDDTTKIREAVERMTPTQLDQWLKSTRDLFTYVESPQWQETRTWLRGFLKVQAIYSDKEIAQLKSDIRNADASQMLDIMKRIQAKHESLVWMHQASQQSRAMQVQQRNASVAQQAAVTAKARAANTQSLPLFGTGAALKQKPSKGYQPPGPLIDSMSVARAAVWRQVWGGMGWGVGF